jgi:hypothetical protein
MGQFMKAILKIKTVSVDSKTVTGEVLWKGIWRTQRKTSVLHKYSYFYRNDNFKVSFQYFSIPFKTIWRQTVQSNDTGHSRWQTSSLCSQCQFPPTQTAATAFLADGLHTCLAGGGRVRIPANLLLLKFVPSGRLRARKLSKIPFSLNMILKNSAQKTPPAIWNFAGVGHSNERFI